MTAVAIVGVVSGFLLKLRSFLIVVGALFVATVGWSAFRGLSFSEAAFIVMGAQFLLQLCYFAGVTISVMSGKNRRPYSL